MASDKVQSLVDYLNKMPGTLGKEWAQQISSASRTNDTKRLQEILVNFERFAVKFNTNARKEQSILRVRNEGLEASVLTALKLCRDCKEVEVKDQKDLPSSPRFGAAAAAAAAAYDDLDSPRYSAAAAAAGMFSSHSRAHAAESAGRSDLIGDKRLFFSQHMNEIQVYLLQYLDVLPRIPNLVGSDALVFQAIKNIIEDPSPDSLAVLTMLLEDHEKSVASIPGETAPVLEQVRVAAQRLGEAVNHYSEFKNSESHHRPRF